MDQDVQPAPVHAANDRLAHARFGGAASGEGNLISGNGTGINIYRNGYGGAPDNRIVGNRIGTTLDGTAAIANGLTSAAAG